jgi:hypothetical protein
MSQTNNQRRNNTNELIVPGFAQVVEQMKYEIAQSLVCSLEPIDFSGQWFSRRIYHQAPCKVGSREFIRTTSTFTVIHKIKKRLLHSKVMIAFYFPL